MVLKNTVWSILGILTFALSQWLIVIAISKLMGPGPLGLYSLAVSITNPIFSFTNLQLRAHFATDKFSDNFKTYLGVRILMGGVACLVIVSSARLFNNSKTFLFLIIAVVFFKYIDSLSDITYAIFQKEKLLRKTAISMIFRGIIAATISIAALVYFSNIVIGVFTIGIVWCIILIRFDLKNIRGYLSISSPYFSRYSWKLIKATASMGIAVMLSTFAINVPRYLIAKDLGPEQLGIFSAQSYIVTFFSMFSVALSTAISTDLMNNANSDRRKFLEIIIRNLAILFLIIIAMVLLISFKGETIIGLIYTDEFVVGNKTLLMLLTFSAGFWGGSCVLDYGIISMRKLNIRPIVSLLTILSILVSWYLFKNIYQQDIGGIMMLIGGLTQFLAYTFIIYYFLIYKNKLKY